MKNKNPGIFFWKE